MSGRRTLKAIHLASIVWLILCVSFLLILALRQAGFHWWVIFSLSGQSIVLVFLLVSIYVFAIFRGASRTQQIEIEHPLTSTSYYMAFYVLSPFLGTFAGCIAMAGENRAVQFLVGITLGTFSTTFLVWVIVDPLTGLLETMLPAESRRHRTLRLVQARAERERKQKERQQLLTDILAKEQIDETHWRQVLKPYAEKLAALLVADRFEFEKAQREVVGIGLSAWQMGGINCMRQLRDMALAMSKQQNPVHAVTDYVSFWWDGIGTWRSPSLD